MYPPSNNNCNYNPILSSFICQNIPASPCMQYEHELYFQSYHHDDQYYFQQQLPLLEDLSPHILADSCTETVTKPSNCTDNVIITSYHVLEGMEEGGGGEGRGGKKGDDVMSSRISIISGRISKNNKRSSTKDRHSKINTARGPRDRRMRLSLDAARKFFRLQDLLGFDKASKTVEWLLTKSDSAIEELAAKVNDAQVPHINKQTSCNTTTTTTTGIGAICTSNSISESCEVISGTDETSSNEKNEETAKDEKKKRKKAVNPARRAAFKPLTKESRNQARARARERAKTKKMSQIGKSKAPAHDLNPSGSRRLANKTCEEPGTHEQLTFLHEENSVDDCNLVVNGNWNPFSIFNYHEQNAGISNEHQLVADFQFCGKLWES